MKKLKLIVSSLLIAIPLVSVSMLTGCASITDRPSVGSEQCAGKCSNRITNSIVSRLQSDSMVSNLPVEVVTCRQIVTVTGKVHTQQQLERVLYIASHTRGVALVRTGIVVQDPFINH